MEKPSTKKPMNVLKTMVFLENFMKTKYMTAYHQGGLKECLQTERPITKELFQKLINTKIYEFYAYDERIKANRYIIYEMSGNYGLPEWLHEYINRPE